MKVVRGGCLSIALLLLGACYLPYGLHDYALLQFKRSFSRVTHLRSSVLLHEWSQVGLLEGNGNHCDYLAAQFRETDQSPAEVRQHYAPFTVPRSDPSYETGFGAEVPVRVEFPDLRTTDLAHLTSAETNAAIHRKRTKKTLYVVYAIDAGYPPDFDFRCH